MNPIARVAIFASGGGTNAEAIIRYFENHESIKIQLVICNNPNAYVLSRAANLGVPSMVFSKVDFGQADSIIDILRSKGITHVVLAGFLLLVSHRLLEAFPQRMINIHPALLPKYGGKGMYGMKVHEAVKSSYDPDTGITIHEVDKNYDEGRILFQAKIKVSKADTPENIANKVHTLEHIHYPQIIEQWITSPSSFQVKSFQNRKPWGRQRKYPG